MKNKINSCLGNFGYQGRVSAKIVDKNNHILQYNNSHNGGTPTFFANLASLLANEPGVNISNIRPGYIALYTLKNQNLAANASWSEITGQNSPTPDPAITNVTQLVPLESRLAVNNSDSKYTNLQLKIPFTYIAGDKVHLFALFPESIATVNNTNDEVAITRLTDAIAYYKLTSGGTWAPFDIDKTVLQNSLVIDWSLAFSDKGE
jgi:hypothetical protein